MFKEEYIIDLLSGKLTEEGYRSILGTVAMMVHKYHWPKLIVVSDNIDNNWKQNDINELAHQFLEWVLANEKLKYLDKIPKDYIAYYFTQMLVSYVANRIKEEQQKVGVSFQKCNELVHSICEEDYHPTIHMGKLYVKSESIQSEVFTDDISEHLKYMAHYPINETTKQIKPIVNIAIGDILLTIEAYVSIDTLSKAVFELLDQSAFHSNDINYSENSITADNDSYKDAIGKITSGISQVEAQIIVLYLFDNQKISLADIASKYNLPKSSVHKMILDFKQKISSVYVPKNEDEGILFLKNLANALDEKSK